MRVKLQADADLNQHIINAARRLDQSIDFRSAKDANLTGLTDLQVLQSCAAQQRLLVSHDQRTMPKYFAAFIENYQSYGVLIVSQKLSVVDVAENILLISQVLTAEDWINRIAFLPL